MYWSSDVNGSERGIYMSDIIRELYLWQITQVYPKTEETKELKKARDELDPLHQKIVSALKNTYGDEAERIENEWYGTLMSVSVEESLQDFKHGFYLGFKIAELF